MNTIANHLGRIFNLGIVNCAHHLSAAICLPAPDTHTKMIQQVWIFVFICWTGSTCFGFKLWGQECQVHIENKHKELIEVLNNQQKLNLNNWNHVGLLIMVITVGLLLAITCCLIRIRYWPLIKVAHNTPIRKSHSYTPSPDVRPYLIQVKGQTHETVDQSV
jgi:hypothetical protein